MILLDTNVLSELARSTPAPTVLAWARAVPIAELCTTVITEAELRFGVALLPAGARRTALTQAIATQYLRVWCRAGSCSSTLPGANTPG
ncbi:MAG: PIN domain-containing protein [Acetobacteraceae bacterium]